MRQLQANHFDVEHESKSDDASIVIINTCGFIDDSKEESIDTIIQFTDAKKAGLVDKVYVTGCLSQRYKPELEKEITDVDAWFGTKDMARLLKTMNADYKKELVGERLLTTPGHYAYFKIAEGCDRPCSFCAIPIMRGKHVSTPMENLVTQAEYLAVIGSNPSFSIGTIGTRAINRPVEQVSWVSAVAYCATLTTTERAAGRIPADWAYRLPTEAEWEYCSRAGARNTRFGYGDDIGETALGDYAWYSSNSGGTTHPVEQKRANSWGLMDMHGNVSEWCQDWYAAYPAGSATDPQGPGAGRNRVIRGGSWNLGAVNARCALRLLSRVPGFTDRYIGFRVVLAPGQP